MILAPDEAALFYRALWPLLAWVNDRRRVVPPFPMPSAERPLGLELANPIRKVLWADDALREQFLAEGATHLGAAERELIASWKHRVDGSFILLKHLQQHSIFIDKEVFGVLGLYSPLAELVRVPAYVHAVVLPFGDRIIIDGILSSPGVQLDFGVGMRRMFEAQYADARKRSAIRTSLVSAPTPGSRPKRARAPKPSTSTIVGTWRITSTELWDRDALDLIEPAHLAFSDDNLGELAMIAVRGDIDYRLATKEGRPHVDFTFAGDDDGQPISGRAWATLHEDDVLRGRLYLHRGDDSAFEAVRMQGAPKARRRRRR